MTAAELVHHLRRKRYRVGQEIWLQDDIEASLRFLQIAFEREARMTARDRIDFLVAGGIGIEAKTRCPPSSSGRWPAATSRPRRVPC